MHIENEGRYIPIAKFFPTKQCWKAWKLFFAYANRAITKPENRRTFEERRAVAIFEDVIYYERRRRFYNYPTTTDWELYRLAYQDSIWMINRLRRGKEPLWRRMDASERAFAKTPAEILEFVRTNRMGKFNRQVIYRIQRKCQKAYFFNPNPHIDVY